MESVRDLIRGLRFASSKTSSKMFDFLRLKECILVHFTALSMVSKVYAYRKCDTIRTKKQQKKSYATQNRCPVYTLCLKVVGFLSNRVSDIINYIYVYSSRRQNTALNRDKKQTDRQTHTHTNITNDTST